MDGDLDQLHRMLRMLSQIQALAHDPDAAGLVQSGALLAAGLGQVLQHVQRAPHGPMVGMELMEGMGVLVPMSAFFPLLLQQGVSASRQRGLGERALARLPEVAVTSEMLARLRSSNGGEALCAICHEDYQIGQKILQLPCQHLFCVDCSREWLQQCNTCPVCRSEIRDEVDEGRSRDGGWHTEELFPYRFPQGSPLAAVRGARQAQSSASLELWPPVDEVARIAEQHSAWPRLQEDASSGPAERQQNTENPTEPTTSRSSQTRSDSSGTREPDTSSSNQPTSEALLDNRVHGPAIESNPTPPSVMDSPPPRQVASSSTDASGGFQLPTAARDTTRSPGRASTTPARQKRQSVRNPNAQSGLRSSPGASGSRTASVASERIRSSTQALLPSVARTRETSFFSTSAPASNPRSAARTALTRSISVSTRLSSSQGAPARALHRSSVSGPRQ